MPIRDMDMYATWQRQQSQSGTGTSYCDALPTDRTSQGRLHGGVGVPVGSNRGANGIDGVLSTAAGFAAGLKRGVTLTVGDVSFLHDINGLNLLRTGEHELRTRQRPCSLPCFTVSSLFSLWQQSMVHA